MLCPLCNKQAISPHHIKSRAEGGTDDFRNIVWLCKRCHDEIEGQTITPRLIELKRLEKLGKGQTAQEVYNYRYTEGGVIFMGISINEEWLKDIPSFIISYDSQFIMPVKTKPNPKLELPKPRRKTGRPKLSISPELLLQNSSLSLRKRAKASGVSYETIRNRLSKNSSIENDTLTNNSLENQG